jgi:hypothetical protein
MSLNLSPDRQDVTFSIMWTAATELQKLGIHPPDRVNVDLQGVVFRWSRGRRAVQLAYVFDQEAWNVHDDTWGVPSPTLDDCLKRLALCVQS